MFLGILPGEKLPSQVPGHPACQVQRGPYFDDDAMTVYFSECPGVDTTVERVIQVNQNQLLWVQIRSEDQRVARRVLDSVETFGY